ncbi:hypothetical protein BKA82DRAFT_1004891 [Pisolithus tinctorius]|uniref:Uncharacterized protein n=1 Tax=Pisolithus tinctorius Marx 270 TaxID=870435 RepID=A0A0C3MWJ7_PISTI|nr:hypothetical protein BKA82DRAFT_1004891 [Pisolithus tinctorius]KIN93309.1 hypothetical protein M404DRAFT_1009045 [Pisolithus tinctorius Marx 270]KIN99213.1 hypothetical protein M404DRAFT_1004891 [Pisolithus tinctorius Marx 270]
MAARQPAANPVTTQHNGVISLKEGRPPKNNGVGCRYKHTKGRGRGAMGGGNY